MFGKLVFTRGTESGREAAPGTRQYLAHVPLPPKKYVIPVNNIKHYTSSYLSRCHVPPTRVQIVQTPQRERPQDFLQHIRFLSPHITQKHLSCFGLDWIKKDLAPWPEEATPRLLLFMHERLAYDPDSHAFTERDALVSWLTRNSDFYDTTKNRHVLKERALVEVQKLSEAMANSLKILKWSNKKLLHRTKLFEEMWNQRLSYWKGEQNILEAATYNIYADQGSEYSPSVASDDDISNAPPATQKNKVVASSSLISDNDLSLCHDPDTINVQVPKQRHEAQTECLNSTGIPKRSSSIRYVVDNQPRKIQKTSSDGKFPVISNANLQQEVVKMVQPSQAFQQPAREQRTSLFSQNPPVNARGSVVNERPPIKQMEREDYNSALLTPQDLPKNIISIDPIMMLPVSNSTVSATHPLSELLTTIPAESLSSPPDSPGSAQKRAAGQLASNLKLPREPPSTNVACFNPAKEGTLHTLPIPCVVSAIMTNEALVLNGRNESNAALQAQDILYPLPFTTSINSPQDITTAAISLTQTISSQLARQHSQNLKHGSTDIFFTFQKSNGEINLDYHFSYSYFKVSSLLQFFDAYAHHSGVSFTSFDCLTFMFIWESVKFTEVAQKDGREDDWASVKDKIRRCHKLARMVHPRFADFEIFVKIGRVEVFH